jgi:hypothetical protein
LEHVVLQLVMRKLVSRRKLKIYSPDYSPRFCE